MKVTVILIISSVLGTVHKAFVSGLKEFEIRGYTKTIQTIALLRSARILRRVLKTWKDLLSLKLQLRLVLKKLAKNDNNDNKMQRKTSVWMFRATNKRNLTREDLDMTKKGKWVVLVVQWLKRQTAES